MTLIIEMENIGVRKLCRNEKVSSLTKSSSALRMQQTDWATYGGSVSCWLKISYTITGKTQYLVRYKVAG